MTSYKFRLVRPMKFSTERNQKVVRPIDWKYYESHGYKFGHYLVGKRVHLVKGSTTMAVCAVQLYEPQIGSASYHQGLYKGERQLCPECRRMAKTAAKERS
jgi:hypothetical protein